MEELLEYRSSLVEGLGEINQDIKRVIVDLPVQSLHSPWVKGTITPHQLLAHLRLVELEIFAPRIHRILEENQPYLDLFEDEYWMQASYNPAEPVEDILLDYEQARHQEITEIEHMPISAWNRTGRHPWFGVRTLQWWVELCLTYSRERLSWLRAGPPQR